MRLLAFRKRLLVEHYLGEVCDYKFLCFNGRPYYCWVDIDRFSDHKRNIYNLDWEMQPFTQEFKNYNGTVEKPQKFDQMIELVEKLAKGFEHVRVDLYNCKGDIFFGEMTFTNGSGLEIIEPEEWDYELGKLWDLDTTKRDLSLTKIKELGR